MVLNLSLRFGTLKSSKGLKYELKTYQANEYNHIIGLLIFIIPDLLFGNDYKLNEAYEL